MLGRVDIHYFDQSRTADHGIQFFAVNLQVVAQVAQFLDYARVPFGVDVFCVDARFVVEIVERGLVAAFVQQEESFHRTGGLSLSAARTGRRGARFFFPAGVEAADGCAEQQKQQ